MVRKGWYFGTKIGQCCKAERGGFQFKTGYFFVHKGFFCTMHGGDKNFIRFKFRHVAIFSRFSTQISDQVALKLPGLSRNLHTRPFF